MKIQDKVQKKASKQGISLLASNTRNDVDTQLDEASKSCPSITPEMSKRNVISRPKSIDKLQNEGEDDDQIQKETLEKILTQNLEFYDHNIDDLGVTGDLSSPGLDQKVGRYNRNSRLDTT